MAFFSPNQLEVLAFLFAHEGEDRSLSELGHSLGKHPGVFRRGVDALEKEGIIVSRARGNQRLVSLNKGYLFYNEVRTIVRKSAGVEGTMRTLVEREKNVTIALIYGSYASDKMKPESDIDLLVVQATSKAEDEFMRRLLIVERKLGREISCKIYLKAEFQRKLRQKDPFLEKILSRKIILLKGNL